MLYSLLIVLSFAAVQVRSHGFMAVPVPRDYAHDIQLNIDALRNPSTPSDGLCRNKKSDGSTTEISLEAGKPFTVQIALSIGAEHIGSCSLELYDSAGQNKITLAQDVEGCTNHPHTKAQTTAEICPNSHPAGLITNDMCLYPWTIVVPSLAGLNYSTGFLRWIWTAKHFTPFEKYENCADVVLNGATPSTAATQRKTTSTSTRVVGGKPGKSTSTKHSKGSMPTHRKLKSSK